MSSEFRPDRIEKRFEELSAISKESSGTETPHNIPDRDVELSDVTYDEVENVVCRFLPNSQMGLKLVLAVAISSQYKSTAMLWLLLVGEPSSGKTDLVRLIKDCTGISYYLDNLTQNAFISGERPTKTEKVHDLLPELNGRCLVIKDWTAIFSLDEKMTRKIMGDLVGIYDKEFTKFSSRRGNVSYLSAFSQLGCITPATLNKHNQYLNMVGARFLHFALPQTTEEEEDESFNLIFSGQDRDQLEREARSYVSRYLRQLARREFKNDPLNPEVQGYIRLAARFMSHCRGTIVMQSSTFKNEQGEDVTYYDMSERQIEKPYRAVQQIIALARFLAFIAGKDEVGVSELQIIKEVVISSMPADRAQALRVVIQHGGEITAKELSESSLVSTRTSRRMLDMLAGLDVLEKTKGMGTIANGYSIKDAYRDFLLMDSSDFIASREQSTTRESRDERRHVLLVKVKKAHERTKSLKLTNEQIQQYYNKIEPSLVELEDLGVSRTFSDALFLLGSTDPDEELSAQFRAG